MEVLQSPRVHPVEIPVRKFAHEHTLGGLRQRTLFGRKPTAVQERQHIRERRTPEQIRKNNQPSVCRWSVLCHSLDGLLQRFCQGSGFADSKAADPWEYAATGGWTGTRVPRKPFQSDSLDLKCPRSSTVRDAGYRPFIICGCYGEPRHGDRLNRKRKGVT